MSRVRLRRAVLVAAALPLASRIAVAAPTTMGIEWEMNPNDIVVIGFLDDTIDDASPNAKRILCTDERVTTHGKELPLLAVTYDNGDTERVFEMVTAPRRYDHEDDWAPVLAAVNQFFIAVSTACSGYPCTVSSETVLSRLPEWNDCGNSRKLLFRASRPPATMQFLDADPQVNLAVDLTSILSDTVPYTQGRNDSGDRTDAAALRDHVRQRILDRGVELLPNARAFLAWYFIASNLHFLAQQRLLVDEHAWAAKNLFDVFLKAPLNDLYRVLENEERNEVSTFLAQLAGPDEVIPNTLNFDESSDDGFVDLSKNVSPKGTLERPAEDPRDPFCWSKTCRGVTWRTKVDEWAQDIREGSDPMDLEAITNPIDPVRVDGHIEVVVELRDTANLINRLLRLDRVKGQIAIPAFREASNRLRDSFQP